MQTYWVYRGVAPFQEEDVTFAEEPTEAGGLLIGITPYGDTASIRSGGELKTQMARPPVYSKGELISCPGIYKSPGKTLSARLTDSGAWQYRLEMEDPSLDEPALSGYRDGKPFSLYFLMEFAAIRVL